MFRRFAAPLASFGLSGILGALTLAACASPTPRPAAQPVSQRPDPAPPLDSQWPPPLHSAGSNAASNAPQVESKKATAPRREAASELPKRELMFEGFAFTEFVYGAESFDPTLPLVIVFHGRGDQPRAPGGPFRQVHRPLRILMPRAPDAFSKGYAWLPVHVRSSEQALLTRSLAAMVDDLAFALKRYLAAYPCSGRPVVTGFSQGGLLTFALALHHAELFSAALPLAGWLPEGLVPEVGAPLSRFPPIRAMHGARDERIPVEATRALVAKLRGKGLSVDFVEFPEAGHAMDAAMNELFRQWLEEALLSLGRDAEAS